jgi:hypothetical protein
MLFTLRTLLAVAVLFVSLPASAVPVVYGYTAGSITVQARQSSDNALVFDETLALGTDSFITWDAAGTPGFGGPGTVDDILLRVQPGQGPFATLIPYGPFDQITIVSAEILPDLSPGGPGFSTLFTFPSGPSTVSVQFGAVEIDAFYDASDSGGGGSSGPTAATITGITNPSGTVTFSAGTIQLELGSIVMGTVDGTPFGEAGNDLNLTANITLFADSNVTPTPEPATAMLLALGLVGMSAASRARRNDR